MAARLLIALVSALALVGGGYWWGHAATDNAWAARQAEGDRRAAAALQKETERADAAAGAYLRNHLDQEDRYAQLDTTYRNLRRRSPLVVVRGPVAAAACGNPPLAQAPPASAGPAPGDADADAEPGPVLTLAAVRMWNGALTGSDQAAGACGPAGAAEGADAACAESSGLSLDDAWANHAVNAKSCASDRQRYQHLIDFLNGK